MPAYQRLRQQLQHQAQITAGHLIETGTTVVVTYGGGPANQYGLQSSGTAIVDDLTARGVTATQIPANSDHGFGRLVDLDPARVAVWVTDP